MTFRDTHGVVHNVHVRADKRRDLKLKGFLCCSGEGLYTLKRGSSRKRPVTCIVCIARTGRPAFSQLVDDLNARIVTAIGIPKEFLIGGD